MPAARLVLNAFLSETLAFGKAASARSRRWVLACVTPPTAFTNTYRF